MRKKDIEGNILKISDSGLVTIDLKSEVGRIRNIGTYVNGVYIKFDEERHIFRKLNAWSINYDIYKIASKVIIKTRSNTYTLIPKKVDPKILHFKGSGIEKKVYIPLDNWVV